MPLDIAWVLGAGLGFGDYAVLSIPFGVTLGRTLHGDNGMRFTPYMTPRLILDAAFGVETGPNGGASDDVDLDFTVDIGLDLALQRAWTVRFGATLGDRSGLAIGLVF